MKVLFDQGTPEPLRKNLQEHPIDTLAEKGWATKDNGELLDLAQYEGYSVLVTTDQNIQYQQNLQNRQIGIVVLLSRNWNMVRLHLEDIKRAIEAVRPGSIITVRIGNP